MLLTRSRTEGSNCLGSDFYQSPIAWLNSISPFIWLNLLRDFENSEKTKRPERGETEGAGPLPHVDPDHLNDGADYDDAVEPVEGGGEVGGQAQGVHPDPHFKNKQTEEGKFSIIWNDKIGVTKNHPCLFCSASHASAVCLCQNQFLP